MSESDVQELGDELWSWRCATQFRTSDDIPRVDRPPTWLPVFTPESVATRVDQAARFRDRWAAIDVSSAPVPVQVDHRLLGSALARVTWECEMLRSWERDAVFLVGQALGPYFDLLLRPPPFNDDRQAPADGCHSGVLCGSVEAAAMTALSRPRVRPVVAGGAGDPCRAGRRVSTLHRNGRRRGRQPVLPGRRPRRSRAVRPEAIRQRSDLPAVCVNDWADCGRVIGDQTDTR